MAAKNLSSGERTNFLRRRNLMYFLSRNPRPLNRNKLVFVEQRFIHAWRHLSEAISPVSVRHLASVFF